MGARYQVIAECAHVPVTDHSGVTATHLLYKGAFLPDGVDPKRLEFLLEGGFVAEPGEEPIAPNASVPQDPARGLDSVTTESLQGKPAQEPGTPASDVSAEVASAVRAESGIDKAAESPREASNASEVDAKRAAAKAKLAELGGKAPDGRASQAVWVEYLVSRGSRYEDVQSVDKADLIKLAEQQKS
ncbi:hypothetical protein AMIS_20880 [Actinoplanes missouriensis 431]|uniref:Uncharacterized protein n=1 Tax=Actinoplanes missouriensis (strain ATCC 14538 / DSM 43046 / CBS 188.64 / JCM 3121 / NBRC 102363 / NCIMB 12654 / NRRL B-3342 / UNCC 431) TaxID=512565 RepID=I0H2S1_ACTM4|nr:hypothetical protein [Actinoplanes missouriensis]BAL87308.1 hypothetical protein AMIS_20880 [Actinoplanes missouriensis 431]